MLQRLLQPAILSALGDTPVVFVQGARQVGKSTLVQVIAEEAGGYEYLSLDSAAVRSAAAADPDGFVAGLPDSAVIDEVQRVPELALAIKRSVDRDRRPGRFLLTGSASVLTLPNLSDSLAGRMELLTLWPFSQAEAREQPRNSFVDACFKSRQPASKAPALPANDLAHLLITGGYPEALERKRPDRRTAWFDSYITTILQRDIRDLANVENITDMPRLLQVLAARTSGLVNYADIARDVGLSQTTLKRYMALFDATFLTQRVPAWFTNRTKRLAKSAKIMMTDTGLACHLLGVTTDQMGKNRHLVGPILETLVGMEILKQMSWSKTRTTLHHFRTSGGDEVDFVLEDQAGRIVGVEVKASATVRSGDLKGMQKLAEAAGDAFHRGVVLYTGDTTVPFAKNMHARPLTELWQTG
jgi:uncharacterized protein